MRRAAIANQFRRLAALIAGTAILLAASSAPALAQGQRAAAAQAAPASSVDSSYAAYLAKYPDAVYPSDTVRVPGASGVSSPEAEVERPDSFEGIDRVLIWTNQQGNVTWQVTVKQAGFYSLKLRYFPLPGLNGRLELGLQINGERPFKGAEVCSFSGAWKDALDVKEAFERDSLGNELAPEQREDSGWLEADFTDSEGYISVPYSLYFHAGDNQLTLESLRGSLAVGDLTLYQPEEAPAYAAIKPQRAEGAPSGYIQKIQAERPSRKSDAFLRAGADKASPATEPSDPLRIRRNILGGSSWNTPSQWVEWTFTVPKTGYYKLAFRYRQNAVRGLYTSRRVFIDGKVPCKELEAVRFSYGTKWQIQSPGNEEPYLFYLEAETVHTIRMEVTTGETGDILYTLQQNQVRLNELYRTIRMITGSTPDLYRDYELETEIPGLLDTMLTMAESLEHEAAALEKTTGQTGSDAAVLFRLADQLRSMVRDPYSIPERLGNFGDNIAALAAWIMGRKGQPLELDYIAVMAPDAPLPSAEAGLWTSLWYGIQAFFDSFFTDYNRVGAGEGDDPLEVWFGTGMEQMGILARLADRGFSRQTGTPVSLKLVSSTLLMQAIMAGVGPDVAINVARTEPVNLALRGAAEPLSKYAGFDGVLERFQPSAMTPYRFYGEYYALPETQSFHMMFCRTDILEDLGLQPPDTWEALYALTPILQHNNMEVGMPAEVFNMLLLQNGGTFYNAGKTGMAFDTPEAAASFMEWVEFYTQYGFSLFKDDYTRFRTGEMPISIMPYTFYCQLAFAAPEIRGSWEMRPVPGKVQENGEILRTESATGTACILLADSGKKDEGWAFLDWWTSAQTQTQYGLELEQAMGTVARHPTANLEAFGSLPWTAAEKSRILQQWTQVTELAEVPGGYYVTRNLDNAFKACVYRQENPREMLRYWTGETNKEIRRKLDQYHMGAQE